MSEVTSLFDSALPVITGGLAKSAGFLLVIDWLVINVYFTFCVRALICSNLCHRDAARTKCSITCKI